MVERGQSKYKLPVEGQEKISGFPAEIYLPVLIWVSRNWEALSKTKEGEEEKRLVLTFGKPRLNEENAQITLTNLLLSRISWIVPPEEMEKVKTCLLPEDGLLHRRQMEILQNRYGLRGGIKTLKSLAEDMGITDARVGQIQKGSELVVVHRLSRITVQTITGHEPEPLSLVLKQNLEIIFKEIDKAKEIPVYENAPEGIWEIRRFLNETVEANQVNERRLKEATVGLYLSPDEDFAFSKEIFGSLALRWGTKINNPNNSDRSLFFSDFIETVFRFKKTLDELRGPRKPVDLFPERAAKRELKRCDFQSSEDDKGMAMRVYNALGRGRVPDVGSLLKQTPDTLEMMRDMGNKGLAMILRFLQREYPNEKLTKELEEHLK